MSYDDNMIHVYEREEARDARRDMTEPEREDTGCYGQHSYTREGLCTECGRDADHDDEGW